MLMNWRCSVSDQIIHLSPDELNKLQAALDAPMTVEDAEDVLSEYGFLIQPTLMTDGEQTSGCLYWEVSTGRTVLCKSDQEVINLAQEELEKDVA